MNFGRLSSIPCSTSTNRIFRAYQGTADLGWRPSLFLTGNERGKDEIMDAQQSFTMKANIVADILTNIQNLYKVANKQDVIRIQDEFFKIYQEGDNEKLEKFSKDLI